MKTCHNQQKQTNHFKAIKPLKNWDNPIKLMSEKETLRIDTTGWGGLLQNFNISETI